MSTLVERRSEGVTAQELMRRLEPYTDILWERYVKEMVSRDSTPETRDALHTKIHVLSDLKDTLRRTIEDGVIADNTIKAQVKKS